MQPIEEQIRALAPKEKARALQILKDLELTEWQRYWRGLWERVEAEQRDCKQRGVNYWQERQAKGLPDIAEVLSEMRRNRDNPDRKPTLGQILRNKPDELARQERLRSESEERALAVGASYKKAQQAYLEREAACGAYKTPSVQEVARQAQDQAFAEARPAEGRVCGPRYGWMV